MSYHITVPNLRRWLDKAQLALVSKNKVRKDLWTDFSDVILFEEGDNTIPLSSSEFTTIQSFLQTEGRSESLSNDSFLNWITMLHDLRRKLNKELGIRSAQRSPVESDTDSEIGGDIKSPHKEAVEAAIQQAAQREDVGRRKSSI